jgi:hypothetical protein
MIAKIRIFQQRMKMILGCFLNEKKIFPVLCTQLCLLKMSSIFGVNLNLCVSKLELEIF